MIAEEAEALHSVELRRKIAEELRRTGFLVTKQDLLESRLELGGTNHDRISRLSNRNGATTGQFLYRPASAGDYGSMGALCGRAGSLPSTGTDWLKRWKQGEWRRLRYAGDSEMSVPPLARLLSPIYWKDLAARASDTHAADFVAPGEVGRGDGYNDLVTADRWGNIVTATQTLGEPFGSRVMVPGTGIWLNNSLCYSTFEPKGNPMDVHPGRHKLISNMPVIVSKMGEPVMALGAPGGHTIPQTVPGDDQLVRFPNGRFSRRWPRRTSVSLPRRSCCWSSRHCLFQYATS